MGPKRLTIGDLPADWYTKHGEEIAVLLAQRRWRGKQQAWRGHLNRFSDIYWKTLPVLNDETLSRHPMELKLATQLVNRVAFCYIVSLETRQWQSGKFTGHAFKCMREAINTWDSLHAEDAKKDDMLPFACVRLPPEDCTTAEEWLGLGMTRNVEEIEVPAIRETALDHLIKRHRQLCDLVQERVCAPAQPGDEEWLNYELSARHKWNSHPTQVPTCRAVICISTYSLTDARTVLLVLTGENDQLCAGAPTFADIPASEIIDIRSPTVVEVTLKTALWFLTCIEAAEVASNDELQRLINIRRANMGHEFLQEARTRLQSLSREGSNDKELWDMQNILRSVLGDEIK